MELAEAVLRKKILADRYNAIAFGAARGNDIYLVGGYLRDVLLGRKCHDRDFVARGGGKDMLAEVAARTGARAVRIGERGPHRFFLRNGVTMDFSRLTCAIDDDLLQRDFTVNAMAWSPTTGLIDVCGAVDDLPRRTIRMISPKGMLNDPVRILRAYRIAEELSFTIERNTREVFRIIRGLLTEAKTERITLEFFKVLCLANPPRVLRLLLRDGILECLIDRNSAELRQLLKVTSRIHAILKELPVKYTRQLGQIVSSNLSYKGLLMLEILLKGRPRNMFCLSAAITNALRHLDTAEEMRLSTRHIPEETLFNIFEKARKSAQDFLLTRGLVRYMPDYERYCSIKKRKLVSAEEIQTVMGIPPGKILGDIIERIDRARFTRSIRNRDDAMGVMAKSRLHES